MREYHEDLHFKPGLTYPLRTTSDFSPRILPADVMFSTGGHGIHFRDTNDALVFLSLAYTRFVKVLVEVLFGSGDASVSGSAARNYTAGTMSQLPHPTVVDRPRYIERSIRLARLFRADHDFDETSRTFCALPISARATSIKSDLSEAVADRLTRLDEIASLMQSLEGDLTNAFAVHGNVEDVLSSIYGAHPCSYSERDVAADLPRLVELNVSDLMDAAAVATGGRNRSITKKSFFVDRQIDLCAHALQTHPRSICQTWMKLRIVPSAVAIDACNSLLSFAFGTLFGRWDCRVPSRYDRGIFTTDDPFASLPACPPAMLQGTDDLPTKETPPNYPLRIEWDGILVDDSGHPNDVVRRVRDFMEVFLKDRADGIEKEVCEILGIKDLREFFRKPGKGGFWDDHVSRYSKSRRKAPIYWLLQSSKKNYALWLYYHRLDKDLLFKALVNYVEPKIQREINRLDEMRKQKQSAGESGKGAKKLDKDIERQEDLISELRDFEDKLRRAASLHLNPDLNDGVVLNIAPLHELVPWKEAKNYWEELFDGKYEWSSISNQLREKEIVK